MNGSTNGTTKQLAAASEKIQAARTELANIDLRKTRGNPGLRDAIQEARAAAEDAELWAVEALQLEAAAL